MDLEGVDRILSKYSQYASTDYTLWIIGGGCVVFLLIVIFLIFKLKR